MEPGSACLLEPVISLQPHLHRPFSYPLIRARLHAPGIQEKS